MLIKGLDFQGERINFVQIGLGTNSTFIQNCAGERHEWEKNVDWLLGASSEHRPHMVRGVAVEPVSELVAALRRAADRLPHVELVQVAMGEHEVWGADVQVFSLHERDALLKQVPYHKRESLQNDLEYVLNMSSVGAVHPWVPGLVHTIAANYNIHVDVERRQSDVWTWYRLAKNCNFRGCEVLLIDTEGHDTQILRSLIEHCRHYPDEWPHLIQFETMGHCDKKEGWCTEWAMIKSLQREGYTLVQYSHHNSHLVLTSALQTERRLQAEMRLQDWIGGWTCTGCQRSWQLPYTSDQTGCYCRSCQRRDAWH